MILQSDITPLSCDWQSQLRDVVSSGDELLGLLQLNADQVGYSDLAQREFSLKVPRAFVNRMKVGDPSDPLLRQVLATRQELLAEPGFGEDPVGETGTAIKRPGIIQKYQGRLLLVLSGGCAINCRYCFRRHFPYGDNQNSRTAWLEAVKEIGADRSISEVILSGGDPWLVSDKHLAELIERIAAIAHVKRLRVHTRLPVVIPGRVTSGLLQGLSHQDLKTTVVIHSNHANELDSEVAYAMQAMKERGVTLLNQAVLLRGVNDSAPALIELSERLFDIGVLPYYLHLLDKVRGAGHFDVEESRGRELLAEITARLPGYLVPKLVKEEAGADSKTMVTLDS